MKNMSHNSTVGRKIARTPIVYHRQRSEKKNHAGFSRATIKS